MAFNPRQRSDTNVETGADGYPIYSDVPAYLETRDHGWLLTDDRDAVCYALGLSDRRTPIGLRGASLGSKRETGVRLALIHEDITDWRRSPPGYLPAVSRLARGNHIPFRAIIIAAMLQGPNAAWVAGAERNVDLLKASGAWAPDHLVFATWHA